MLEIICDELGGYSVWPVCWIVLESWEGLLNRRDPQNNCWAFCCLIQQLLESAHGGSFEIGELQHNGIAPHVQRRAYLSFIKAVCAARSAAEQESFRAIPQPVQAQQSPVRGDEGAPLPAQPETHSAPVTSNIPVAGPSAIVQNPLQPGSPEPTQQRDANLRDLGSQVVETPVCWMLLESLL